MSDKETAEKICEDMEYVIVHSGRLLGHPAEPDFVMAIREIGANVVAFAGDGHVPLPAQLEVSDHAHALLIAAATKVNVRVLVSRPHGIEDSEHLEDVAAAVAQVRIGVEQIAA